MSQADKMKVSAVQILQLPVAALSTFIHILTISFVIMSEFSPRIKESCSPERVTCLTLRETVC